MALKTGHRMGWNVASGRKPWGVGAANAPMVTVGLGSSIRDLTTTEVVEFVRDLARAYYEVTGTLPPPVRRADVGSSTHSRSRAQIAKAVAGSKRWNAERKARAK